MEILFHVEHGKEKRKMTELKYLKRTKMNEEGVGAQIVQIKTDDIRPNRAQPRADFEQNAIIRLADSIRRYGILQPLYRQHPVGAPERPGDQRFRPGDLHPGHRAFAKGRCKL